MDHCLICRSQGHDVSAHTEEERQRYKDEQAAKLFLRQQQRVAEAYNLVIADLKENPEKIHLVLDNAGWAARAIVDRRYEINAAAIQNLQDKLKG